MLAVTLLDGETKPAPPLVSWGTVSAVAEPAAVSAATVACDIAPGDATHAVGMVEGCYPATRVDTIMGSPLAQVTRKRAHQSNAKRHPSAPVAWEQNADRLIDILGGRRGA